MKPRRFSAFAGSLFACATAVFTFTSSSVLATPYWWDGPLTGGSWADANNWSSSSAVSVAPGVVPGSSDIATLTAVGITTAGVGGAASINLNGPQAVSGIKVENLVNSVTLVGGSGASILSIGADGINHPTGGGGLIIGSVTEGQEVNISLTANQKWTSSAAGTGQAAIIINNTVSNGNAAPVTLTLGGINQNAIINGVVSNNAGILNIIKTDSGIWSLANNANTYTGTTSVNAGTLRLITPGSLNPATSATTIASGATLSLRVGGAGFTAADIDTYRGAVTFTATGSFLGLDTNNGSFTYSSNITGAHSLNKLGGNTLTLDGANTYSGTTAINEGALTFSTISAYNGNAITVGTGGTLLATAGGANLTTAQIDTLRAASTFTTGGVFAISTANADYIYGSTMSGNLRFQKSGANTLFLTGTNTYTGGVNVSVGILSVDNIRNGTVASALGSSTNAAANLNLAGGRLRYTGAGDTTDRLFQFASASTIDSSGTGALIFSNTGLNATGAGTANARTLTLSGYNKDANRISGIIQNSGTSPNFTSVTKYGSGNWTLSGANTFTGTLRSQGGSLTLDYGVSDPLAAGASVVIGSGVMELKGKAAGVTTETISALNIGDAHNSLGRFVLNGNGGSGVQLTITTLGGNGSSQRHDLIDISGNAGNSITVGALAAPAVTQMGMVNGVLMNAATATAGSSRANIVFRDKDGSYGFAALSGPSSGTLQKLSGQTGFIAGPVNINSATTNYLINSTGTFTQQAAASLVFNTLSVDSGAGEVTLDLGANAITAGANGKGLLFSGSNNISITGTSTAFGGSALWFHNYLDAGKTLNISASFGTGSFMIMGGTGTTIYSGTGLSGNFILNGGLFRATTAQNVAGIMRVNDGGVFEIGADLNAAGAGDLSHAIGVAAGNIAFYGDAGLSAFGGNRVANFGGAGAEVTWGASNFLTFGTGTDGDYTFKLSSSLSDSNIEVQNGINLNGKTRVVEVANGSAEVDATLSGALTGDISAGLIKAGAGTLSLTGASSYRGATRVDAGRLIVGGGGINASTSIQVNNATLEFGSQITPNSLISDNALVTLNNATVIASDTIETMGQLMLNGANQMILNGNNVIHFAKSDTQAWGSTLTFINWVGQSIGGGDDQVYFGSGTDGLTSDQLSKLSFVNPTLDGQSYTGTFAASMLNTGEVVALIPEPSAISLGLIGAAGLLVRRRRSS